MIHHSGPDEVESLLGSFCPLTPPSEVEENLRGAPQRRRRFQRVLCAALGAGLLAGAALILLAVYLGGLTRRKPPPSGASSRQVLRARAVRQTSPMVDQLELELTLRALKDLREELTALQEMVQIVPPRQAKTKKVIRQRLSMCLNKLAELEQEVRLAPERSCRGSAVLREGTRA